MTYNPNIPNPTDLLSNSQGQIKTNFSTANTSFGVDHYAFDNATPNNGFHNKVTTPLIAGSAHPTTTTNPIFYAMQDTVNLGVLQYSRGPSNMWPTPVTCFQSSSSPISILNGATANILDFTGVTWAYGSLYIINTLNATPAGNRISIINFLYSLVAGTPIFTFERVGNTGFTGASSGKILQVTNSATSQNYNQVFWTIDFKRIVI